MPVIDKIQVRRGTAAEWTSVNPVLSSGEFGYETDTGKIKIGDGSLVWASIAYIAGGGGGGGVWGAITGTLSNQIDLNSALAGKQPLSTVLTNTTASFTTAQETKLSGIATGATANSSDAFLLDRTNHTGTQAISTITNLQTILDQKANGVRSSFITITGPGSLEWREVITDSDIIPASNISITPSSGSFTDENESEMLDLVTCAGLPGTGSFEVIFSFSVRTRGVVKFNYVLN